MGYGIAAAAAAVLDTAPPSLDTPPWPVVGAGVRARARAATSFGLFAAANSQDVFSGESEKFVPSHWRKQHNYFLDRGMKFNVAYRSPLITETDIFDLEKFGCYSSRGYQGLKITRSKYDFKQWWKHPSFAFGATFSRIGVRLQDVTTGEIKWDAIYNVGKPEFPKAEESPPCAYKGSGMGLCSEELPIGGTHPFFQPDWCPPPNDGMAHKYKLTISNLSQKDYPELAEVGEILFTQYGPTQLENSYAFENAAKN